MIKNIRSMSHDEVMKLSLLGLDDSFSFRCKSCGKCCKQRKDILLTPYDVYRLARYLCRTPEEIIKSYCETYEGHSSHLPIVRIIPQPPENSCPFLRNRKCVVHAAKPVLCRVFPLARINRGKETAEYYYGDGPSCGHEIGTTTVRDWIADVASDESERAGTVWATTLRRIVPALHDEYEKKKPDDYTQIINAVFTMMYLPYDTAQDFAVQCQKNTETLCELLLKVFGIQTLTYEETQKIIEENEK